MYMYISRCIFLVLIGTLEVRVKINCVVLTLDISNTKYFRTYVRTSWTQVKAFQIEKKSIDKNKNRFLKQNCQIC